MSTIRRDGKAYDGGDVRITMLGAEAHEVEEMSYSTKQEHQKNFSLGSNTARTWSRGKVDDEGSITISMNEGSLIERVAPKGNILDIKPFEIHVSFVNEFNLIVNDTLLVKFQSQGRQVAAGDMGLKFQYELFVLSIDYNNVI